MKALRTIGILVLVAGLMLGSVGTVFAGGPPHDPPGKPPKFEGKKQGFAGNVTNVILPGNVTILTEEGPVVVMLTEEETKYKIPRVMNKWEGNLTKFKSKGELGDDLSGLIERRVVTLAGNLTDTETWKALKFMLLPVPGLPPLHAHRTGNVTEFNPGAVGNITIEDIHGVSHTFDLDADTKFRPRGTTSAQITIGNFVTVVTTGDPKLEPGEKSIAKAIVVHRRDT